MGQHTSCVCSECRCVSLQGTGIAQVASADKIPLWSCPTLCDFSPHFLLSLLMCPPECHVWVNNGMGHKKPRKAYCFLTLKLKNSGRLNSSMQVIVL